MQPVHGRCRASLRTPLAILRTRIETLDERRGPRTCRIRHEHRQPAAGDRRARHAGANPGETADLRAVCARWSADRTTLAQRRHRCAAPMARCGSGATLNAATCDLQSGRERHQVHRRPDLGRCRGACGRLGAGAGLRAGDCACRAGPSSFWRGDRQRSAIWRRARAVDVRGVVEDHDATVRWRTRRPAAPSSRWASARGRSRV